jgi:hypothetical protein
MPNFNRANLSLEPLNVAINDALERAAATRAELPRPYLGASIVGHECARRVQFDWWCKPVLAARTREIFERALFRGARAPSSDRGRLQVRAAGGARLHRARRGTTRARRRHHYRWPATVRALSDLSASMGAQGCQQQKLEGDRARRTREGLPAIRRANIALSGVSRRHQSRAVHRDERRYLRAAAFPCPV